MDEVVIITRDVNGTRNEHYLRWDNVCDYVNSNEYLKDEEILIVSVNNMCIYSAMWTVDILNWDDLVGFFA